MSYVHESPQHRADVLAFAGFLRSKGVDAVLDVWADESRHDWSTWAIREMTHAAFVIVVASPTYREVGDGSGPPDRHHGARSEAALLRDLLHGERTTWTPRVLPVLLPGHDIDEVPRFLSPYSVSRYPVTEYTVDGAEDLLRVIHGKPGHVPPPIQEAPDLAPHPLPTVDGLLWCADMPEIDQGAAAVEVHLVPGEEFAPQATLVRPGVSDAATAVPLAASDGTAWLEADGAGLAVFRTGQRSAWFTPARGLDRTRLAEALAARIELLAGLDLASPGTWVPAAGAGSARRVLSRVAAGDVRPTELAARLAADLLADPPQAPAQESRVSNHVSGHVSGTVIQAGDIHGGINLG